MNIDLIKVGQKLNIIGNKYGCPDKKCRDCGGYPEHEIIVIKIETNHIDVYGVEGHNIKGKRVGDTEFCHFHPDDLEPFHTTWRKRYENKEKIP